jgi:hypothetical protein
MADNAEDKAAARALEMLGGHVEEEDTTEEEQAEVRTEFNEGLANLTDTQPKDILGEAPSSEETVAEAEAQQETVIEASDLPNLDPTLPEDLAEELEMPDWDEDEGEAEEREEEDEEWDGEEDDPRVQALKARLAKAEKKAAWAERKRAESQRAKWEAEAEKYFPLSKHALGDIQATSRRGFLREAKRQHEIVRPHVQVFVEELKKKQDAAVESAKAAALEEAKRAWGRPTVGPGGREQTTETERAEKIKNAKSLEDRVKARIWG